jgi:hypothetical protein
MALARKLKEGFKKLARLDISEELYLSLIVIAFLFISAFFAIEIWVLPERFKFIEYEFGVGIFTSSIFLVLTVILLSSLLKVREMREWASIKEFVYKHIDRQTTQLFRVLNAISKNYDDAPDFLGEHLKYEDDNRFEKLDFMCVWESVKKPELIFNEERLVESVEKGLLVREFSHALQNYEWDEQKCLRFSPKITESIINIEDRLREMSTSIGYLVSDNKIGAEELEYIRKDLNSLYKLLLNEVAFMDKEGIEFEFINNIKRG